MNKVLTVLIACMLVTSNALGTGDLDILAEPDPASSESTVSSSVLFSELGKIYIQEADDSGYLSGELLGRSINGIRIEEYVRSVLIAEYSVSSDCMINPNRAYGIVSDLERIIKITNSTPEKASNLRKILKSNMDSRALPGTECVKDTRSIARFLNDFTPHAKQMRDKKLLVVAQHTAKAENEKKAELLAEQKAIENRKQEEARILGLNEEKARRQKVEDDARKQVLISGAEKPESFWDYYLLYDPSRGG